MQITLLVAFLASITGSVAAQSAVSNQPPAIGPNEVWVSSIPMGAMVYASDDDSGITSPKNLVGKTPLLLKSKPRYIALAIDGDVVRKALSVGYMMTPDVFLDVTARSFGGTVDIDTAGQASIHYHQTYELDYSKRKTLIATFQPKGVSLDTLASIYPAGTNFRFAENRLRQDPLLEGIDRAELDGAIRLLHRGGKVALEREATIIVVEVTGVDSFEITRRQR